MMVAPTTPATRLFFCPACSAPSPGPVQGGPARCARCGAPSTLADRSALLARPIHVPPPDNDPARLAQLRLQDGRPRFAPPTLAAVLGGNDIQPGREQEAVMIWQSLRARAAAGDVAASEDLSMLTLLIAQLPSMDGREDVTEALGESAFDASVLPRHKQEQLGRLVRRAVARGDRARALRYLSWMTPSPPELDADSEARVAAAMVATLDRDGQRVLVLLGQQKDAVPIVDSMDGLASVIRANAWEILGNAQAATQILHELPQPGFLDAVRRSFPALRLCQVSAPAYQAAATAAAAERAASSAGMLGAMLGLGLGLPGLILVGVGVSMLLFSERASDEVLGAVICFVIGGGLALFGGLAFFGGRAKAKRAAWLRTNGLSLPARIVNAERTGTEINDVPVYRFTLEVVGPRGPYRASFDKLAPEHEVARALGAEVRVRADPQKLDDVLLED